jgi:hypothetical protein
MGVTLFEKSLLGGGDLGTSHFDNWNIKACDAIYRPS